MSKRSKKQIAEDEKQILTELQKTQTKASTLSQDTANSPDKKYGEASNDSKLNTLSGDTPRS